MSSHVENVTMLYLQNRDTSHLSLDELYALYRKTLKEVKDCEERYLFLRQRALSSGGNGG